MSRLAVHANGGVAIEVDGIHVWGSPGGIFFIGDELRPIDKSVANDHTVRHAPANSDHLER